MIMSIAHSKSAAGVLQTVLYVWKSLTTIDWAATGRCVIFTFVLLDGLEA